MKKISMILCVALIFVASLSAVEASVCCTAARWAGPASCYSGNSVGDLDDAVSNGQIMYCLADSIRDPGICVEGECVDVRLLPAGDTIPEGDTDSDSYEACELTKDELAYFKVAPNRVVWDNYDAAGMSYCKCDDRDADGFIKHSGDPNCYYAAQIIDDPRYIYDQDPTDYRIGGKLKCREYDVDEDGYLAYGKYFAVKNTREPRAEGNYLRALGACDVVLDELGLDPYFMDAYDEGKFDCKDSDPSYNEDCVRGADSCTLLDEDGDNSVNPFISEILQMPLLGPLFVAGLIYQCEFSTGKNYNSYVQNVANDIDEYDCLDTDPNYPLADGFCPVCGDGTFTPETEECDASAEGFNDNVCVDCQMQPCGNGKIDPGEECDLGWLQNDGTYCTDLCQMNDSDSDTVPDFTDDQPTDTPPNATADRNGFPISLAPWTVGGNVYAIDEDGLRYVKFVDGTLSQTIAINEAGPYSLSFDVVIGTGTLTVDYGEGPISVVSDYETVLELTDDITLEFEGDGAALLANVALTKGDLPVIVPDFEYAAGCCPSDFCWDGETCVSAGEYVFDTTKLPYGYDEGDIPDAGFRCAWNNTAYTDACSALDTEGEDAKTFVIADDGYCHEDKGDDGIDSTVALLPNATWEFSRIKWTPLKTDWGFCGTDTQCYTSVNNCVDTGTYVANDILLPDEQVETSESFYCHQGNWTTRTKALAFVMQDLVGSETDYSIFCDKWNNVLNYPLNDVRAKLESNLFFAETVSPGPLVVKDTIDNSKVNEFCVLRMDDQIYAGVTFNGINPWEAFDSGSSFFDVIREETFDAAPPCEAEPVNGFSKCDDGAYYHKDLEMLVFTKRGESLTLSLSDQNFFDAAITVVRDVINDFLNAVGIRHNKDLLEASTKIIEQAGLLEKVYVGVNGSRSITGTVERAGPGEQEVKANVLVAYKGFTQNLCRNVMGGDVERYDTFSGRQFQKAIESGSKDGIGSVECRPIIGDSSVDYVIRLDVPTNYLNPSAVITSSEPFSITYEFADFWNDLTAKIRIGAGSGGLGTPSASITKEYREETESLVAVGGQNIVGYTWKDVAGNVLYSSYQNNEFVVPAGMDPASIKLRALQDVGNNKVAIIIPPDTVTSVPSTPAADIPANPAEVSCGNGVLDAGEDCDDANTAGGDGCAQDCSLEATYTCSDLPDIACEDGS